MLFGKIDYLNLLPFHIFLKSLSAQNAFKMAMERKIGVPSKLCADLKARRVDAAIISSIEARKYRTLKMGICAKGEVLSVLVRKNSPRKLDPASRSSNMLACILGLNGEVIIGDKALKAYLKDGKENFYDLAKIWQQKTNLPFVFGQFACVKNKSAYEKIIKKFLKKKIKIPRYILNSYATSRNIEANDILWYLSYLHYDIGIKEQKSLKLFISRARALKFNPENKNS